MIIAHLRITTRQTLYIQCRWLILINIGLSIICFILFLRSNHLRKRASGGKRTPTSKAYIPNRIHSGIIRIRRLIIHTIVTLLSFRVPSTYQSSGIDPLLVPREVKYRRWRTHLQRNEHCGHWPRRRLW